MWGWLFGGTAVMKDTTRDLLNLISQLESFSKQEKFLEKEIDKQDKLARKFITTNRTAARAALTFKKEFEFELGRTLGQILTVEYQILHIGTANDLDKETSDAMTEARTTMQRVHSNLTPDRFQQRLENLQDERRIKKEYDEAYGSRFDNTFWEGDMLDPELDALKQEQLNERTNFAYLPSARCSAK